MRCDRCCGFDQMTKLIIFCLNGFRSGNLFRPLEPLKKNPYPPAPHPMPPLERQQLIYVRVSLSFCPAMSFSFAPNWVACAITKKKQRKTGTAWRWRWKIIDKSCKSNFWQFLLIFGYYPQRLCQTEKTE